MNSKLLALSALLLLAVFAFPISAAEVNCTANSGVPPIVRAEGTAEPVGDFVIFCTGGTPTPAGAPVPQMNFTVFLNTNVTSRTTAAGFSEALLLIDEPSSAVSPGVPMLNCGDNGASDNGPSGPGVCSIVSTGVPAQTYSGTLNGFGAAACDGLSGHPVANTYGCGRPNVFQGRAPLSTAMNAVTFLGVPFDPPGAGTRIFRLTNFRADAATLGSPVQIKMDVAVSGPIALTIVGPEQVVGFTQQGLTFAVPLPTPVTSTVRVTEGFAGSFKAKNLSFTVGNGGAGNATFGGSSYSYNGNTNHPPDLAQNVPGAIYNSESMMEWRNSGVNGPPSPNPPLGYGISSIPNVGNPFFSAGLGGLATGISRAGVANQGTRIALTFTGVPGSHRVTVPSVVHLHRMGSPAVNSGVLVLTKTNAAGVGPFTPTTDASIPAGNFAVYEVLWADPFSVEYADIPCTLAGGLGLGMHVHVSVGFAPFYATPPANARVPRFRPASGSVMLF